MRNHDVDAMKRCHSLLVLLAVLACFPFCPQLQSAQPNLCPNLIAILTTVPGNLDAGYAAQRLEIRQCPVDIAKRLGVFQLVAWPANATTPALVYETEEAGFYQFAMIEGVYVFEFMGGTAQPVLAVVFENGIPKIGLRASTMSGAKIISTPTTITIEYIDSKDSKLYRRQFHKSGKTQRKG